MAAAGRKELVIIADDVEGEALAALVINKIRAGFKAVAVKAPGFGDRRKDLLDDIALLTAGEVISSETGHKIENTTLQQLGHAKRVVVAKDSTTIIDGKGTKEAIEDRSKQLNRTMTETNYTKDWLNCLAV